MTRRNRRLSAKTRSARSRREYLYPDPMVQKLITTIHDDIDNSTDDVETYTFAWQGAEYEIDLGPKTLKRLTDVLDKYVAKARKLAPAPKPKVRGKTSPAPSARKSGASGLTTTELRAVRIWADANGIAVAGRGRIKADIIEQWRGAQGIGGR